MEDLYIFSLIHKTLIKLDANNIMVPGAKIKEFLYKAIKEENIGFDLDSYLKEKNIRFSDLLLKIDDIQIQKRAGSDMLVGLKGALWPTKVPNPRELFSAFRQDVYDAMTQMDVNYYYVVELDKFLPSNEGFPKAIPLPQVTKESLVKQRESFANTLDETNKQALVDVLATSPNPLGAFQQKVTELGLNKSWRQYKFGILWRQLSDWVQNNDLEISPTWHENNLVLTKFSPQQILSNIAMLMTDQEVRNLSIPFRAVEALYNTMSKKGSY
jgi:hypothetical protein